MRSNAFLAILCLFFSCSVFASLENKPQEKSLIQELSYEAGIIYKQIKNKFHQTYSEIRFPIRKKLLEFNTSKKMLPPQIGNLTFAKVGSGPTPIVKVMVDNMSDSDGQIQKIRWNFADGSEIELLQGEFSPNAEAYHVFDIPGHYNVVLEVEDDTGAITTKQFYVETSDEIQQTPNFTATVQGGDPLYVYFNLTTDTMNEGWYETDTKITGQDFEYTNPYTNFYLTFPAAGTYTFESTFLNSSNMEEIIKTEIIVGDQTVKSKPIPLIKGNSFYGTAPFTVFLDGSDSFDLDGEIVSYSWDTQNVNKYGQFIEGPSMEYTFWEPGNYTVALKVKDNDGYEYTTYADIHVRSANNTLPWIIAQDINNESGTKTVAFDGSLDSLGVPTKPNMVFWDLGDSTLIKGFGATHNYAPGTYAVKKKVIDLNGETHLLEKNLIVGTSYDAPTAVATYSTYIAKLGQLIDFNGSLSSDPQSSQALEYKWVFDDGEQADTMTVSKSFSERGIRFLRLWVTNTRGLSSSFLFPLETIDELTDIKSRVIVTPRVGVAPLTVTFDATNTNGNIFPITNHEWWINNQVSNDAKKVVTFTEPGTYYFNHVVTDLAGNQSLSAGAVNVFTPETIPTGNLPPVPVLNFTNQSTLPRVISFNCLGTTDPNPGDWFVCDWKINGKAFDSNRNYSFATFDEDILYNLELTAMDKWGAKSVKIHQFDFRKTPVQNLNFEFYPEQPELEQMIIFGAENSTIPGAQITNYTWTFGDGNTASGPTVSHAFTAPGTYTVTLTMTDSNLQSHMVTKTIQIANSLSLEVIASNSDFNGKVSNDGVYKAFAAPESIHFAVEAAATSPNPVKTATWNFGDGTTAYGRQVEHTFHAPGTYNVRVDSESASAFITVIVPKYNNCYKDNSENLCLFTGGNFTPVVSNTLKWVLNNDRGLTFSTNPLDYPVGWAKFISSKGEVIDVSNAVKAVGNTLEVTKSLLPSSVNYNEPYSLQIRTKSDTGESLVGTWPEHYIGSSSLTVNINDMGYYLELVHTGAQWRKEEYVGAGNSVTWNNLAPGKYALIAKKADKSFVQTFELPVGSKTVTIDTLGTPALKKKRSVSTVNKLKLREKKFNSSPNQSLCGEPTPFPETTARQYAQGEFSAWNFSSANPGAQNVFNNVPTEMQKPIKLSCGVTSEGLLFGQYKWKYKEGPRRCWNSNEPHFFWQEYLNGLQYEDSPIVVKYEIHDRWTDDKVLGHFVTSARDIMLKNGLNLEDLSARVGVPNDPTHDWAQRIDYNISVPSQFKRPEIRFELYSDHNPTTDHFYSVECDVISGTNTNPKLIAVEATSMNTDVHTEAHNGRLSLSRKFGFFPVQYDDRTSSPVNVKENVFKASYDIEIYKAGRTDIFWQGVEVEFQYAGQTHTEIYNFTGAGTQIEARNIYKNQIIVDAADLEGQFSWIRGEDKVTLKFTPVGRITADYDYRGESKSIAFMALFDIQTARESLPQICEGGIFSANVSMFVRDEYLGMLFDSNLANARLRCGDMSVPFGGPFELSPTWKNQGHEFGTVGKFRSFNQEGLQDSYDNFQGTSDRLDDVEAYMTFSEDIHNVALIVDEEVGGIPTAKKQIVDYCNPSTGTPVSPCTAETTFANITEAFISELCQVEARLPSTIPPGCPMPDLVRLTRFAKWVEYNSSSLLSLMQATPMTGQLSSGWISPLVTTIGTNWQEDAIVNGKWPDGKMIYKASLDGTYLEPISPHACHTGILGCTTLSKLFTNDTANFESMTLKTGWK